MFPKPDGKGRADEQHDAYGEIVGLWRRTGASATRVTILHRANDEGRESRPREHPENADARSTDTSRTSARSS
jgi:hypothetical protein